MRSSERLISPRISGPAVTPSARSHGSRQPCRLARIPIIYRVKHEFDTRGNAKFFENSEQVFLDGVFAEVELDRNLTIPKTFGNKRDDLFLTRGQQGSRWSSARAAKELPRSSRKCS